MAAFSALQPAPAPQEAPTLTIDALPNALLGLVLALAGREAGPSTALVSKRWNQLVFAEQALWREVVLSDDSLAALAEPEQQERWFACKLRLLQRVGSLVHVFRVQEDHGQLVFRQQPAPGGWQLAQLLQLLSPSHLQALIVNCRWPLFPEVAAFLEQPGNDAEQLAPQLASELQHFTAVQFLSLHGAAFEAEAVQAIAAMQQLRSLILGPALGMPDCLPAVLQELPATLEFLRLSGPRLPPGTMAAVLRHTSLDDLELACYQEALEDPQPLTALRRMTQLQLTCGGDAAVVLPLPCQFAAGLAKYGMVREDPWLGAEGGGEFSPLEVAGALLERAVFSDQQLDIERLVALPSLPRLLEALLPAGQPGYTRLTLSGCWLPIDALQLDGGHGGSALCAHLRTLSLHFCLSDSTFSNVLAAMLGESWGVASLELVRCLLDEPIPLSVLSATRLTSLNLSDNCLEDLPDAPVWAALAELSLHKNGLTCIPPALSGATALRRLVLSSNPFLAIKEEDLLLLESMPNLAELELSHSTAEEMPAVVRAWLGPRLKLVANPEWSEG
ncbi:Adenylate cyclase [Chlorella sorokiniana]|uniref:Adenylate cyclase n=1 Tax=Chlorella sorokiniana TaxID=3076 RepID=A0A2P6TGT4_CHLSO|nr:Adenylate cyclase [Chlorella sorokiniana]|eukprot:PRW33508.1 Adenylate cyclase [Chlorella sorokiniana]